MKKHIIFGLSLIVLLEIVVILFPAEKSPALDRRFRKSIEKNRPQIVLLGDSMLGAGIDNELFSRLIGKTSYKLDWGGSASAFWYLMVKNQICSAAIKPEYLILFYRDTNLTDPTYRIDGNFRQPLSKFSLPKEDLLNKLAYYRNLNPIEKFLLTWYPPYLQKDKIKENLDSSIKYIFPKMLLGKDQRQVDRAVDTIINEKNMDDELLTQSQLNLEEFDNSTSDNFNSQINISFLPEIIRLTKESGIKLILVRVKRRSAAENGGQSDSIKNYIKDLNIYLDINNIQHLDFTENDQIKVQHYANGDHLNEKGRELFTSVLSEKIKPLLYPTQ